jgi:glycosyltransferase involved in cell wall biosynthesis
MDESQKLVSCIMPTCNRRAFVPYAIGFFLQQDYGNKELVVVDDGTDVVEDIIPDDSRIRYIRIKKYMTLGEKRNYCIRESRGNLIMHWDDDDWMAPNRISYQVGELLKNQAEVCGLQKMLYYEISSGKCWLYRYPTNARPWLAGNSLLYTRSFWQRSPFPNRQVASDTQFIFSRNLKAYVALADYRFYVATVHATNTSLKQTKSSLWHPVSLQEIMEITGSNWPPRPANGHIAGSMNQQIRLPDEKNVKKEPGVSACLLSFKRPLNMQKIVDSLHKYSFISEIIVWNNNPAYSLTLQGQKVRVIQAARNTICYGRFLCAKEAVNDLIYFQDDDAIIGNVPELYQNFLKNAGSITYGLSARHYKLRDQYIFPAGEIALLGWGSFIRKEWLGVLDKYIAFNGGNDDFIFRREADKIFTLLLSRPHHAVLAKLQLLPFDSSKGISLYLEKDHNLFIALAIRKALEYARIGSANPLPVTWNVVITCRDYGRYLEEAVISVLLNHADYIITIVDDGSLDNTPVICRRLMDQYPFIRCIRNEQGMGVGYARNQGLAATDSLFSVLLDADDKIGPNYLFEAEKLLWKGADVVNPDAILFGITKSRWTVPDKVSLKMQLERNHVHCCAAFRRYWWEQVGGIDEQMQNWQDYEFWIRMAAAGASITKLPGDHFFYRKHGFSKSSVSQQKRNGIREFIRNKHQKLYELYGV